MLHGAWLVSAIFALLLGAAAAGAALRKVLAERHRTSETTDHVRLVVSILVTFTALVLGLLLSEVKGSFDTFDSRLRAFAGDLVNLDLHLREYGDDARSTRALLREYVAAAIADSWRDEPAPPGDYPRFPPSQKVDRSELGALLAKVDFAVHRLDSPDRFHERLAQSLSNQADETLTARHRLIETAQNTISWPLIMAMSAWLAVVFGVFGLIAPRNSVVHATIVICALCVASAIFVIDDFDSPLDGVITVRSDSMRDALSHIDRP
jgi:hypothetical protein